MTPPCACIDRELPPDATLVAAQRSIRENPQNAPVELSARELMPGVLVSELQIAALTGKLWKPGRVLRVRFLDGDPRICERCIPLAKTWEKYANLKFEFGSDPNAEIRISFKYRGSWSYVGTDCLAVPQDEPTINFGWLDSETAQDEYARVVVHEFGHALGMIHEHQNPSATIPWNKKAVYDYYKGAPNFWTQEQVDINVFTRYSADLTKFSEYDAGSIMLYPIPAAFLMDPAYEVGWNKVPSDTDKKYAGILYPFKTKPIPILPTNGARMQSSIGEMGSMDTFYFDVARVGAYRIETYGRIDTVISIFGPDNESRMVAKDDDGGRGLASRILTTLTPGRYTVRVRHFSPRGTGAYEIGVTREPDQPAPLRLG